MRAPGLQDQRAERADVALVLFVAELAALRLRVQPGVGRAENALGRGLHGPGLRRAIVVLQEASDSRLAGDLTDVAAADAVGERDADALQARERLLGNARAMKVLVRRLAPLVGVLTERDFQVCRHQSNTRREGHEAPTGRPDRLKRS